MKYKIIEDTSYKKEQRLRDCIMFFISCLAVPQTTLDDIIEGTGYLTQC